MKKILAITSLLAAIYACSSNILNAATINDKIAAAGYVSSEPAYSSVGKGYQPSEPAYSSVGKGYKPSEPAYSSVGKGYNSTNSGYSNVQKNNNSSNAGNNSILQNTNQADMDKSRQEALKWIKEHPQESQQLQQMIKILQNQQE